MKNDPAFPHTEKIYIGDGEFSTEVHLGLTKRELIAAMAMQGFISEGAMQRASNIEIAESSVLAADALIAELEKQK